MYVCGGVCAPCLYLVYFLILLALTKDGVGAQELKSPAPDFSRHTIIQPTVHHARSKREISTTRHTEGLHHDGVTMKVQVAGEEYVLDLRLNQDLVSENHVVSYQKDGEKVLHKPSREELDICQYTGKVRGKPGSWVAVSTCHGVRGVIYDGKQMLHIEPAQHGNEVNSHHYLYSHADLNTHHRCGYEGGVTNNTSYDPLLLKKHVAEQDIMNTRAGRYKRDTFDDTQVRGPYSSNGLSRYIELVLVADHGEFLANGDIRTVHRQMKDVANIINSVYSPLNIFIALVGVVVWSEQDEIPLEENGDRTLTNFLQYRKTRLLAEIKNDNAQLLTRQKFQDGVVGKALKGPICTFEFSGGVSTNHSTVIGLVATTIAHEMGHNLGMEHDTEEQCKCPDEKCIMSPSSTSVTPAHWSSCSLKSLALAFERGMDYCLRNKPKRLFDSPTCGNGFVEPGEQCDCGVMADPSERNKCHQCCHPDTCMLRHNATCASGECCDLETCRPKSAGTVCRPAHKECDLPEYCAGYSEFCPRDVHKMDATPCGKHDDAYCVAGSCRSHADQCRLLWGITGETSHDKCYSRNNIRGNKDGNCGFDRVHQTFRACAPEDARCGLLHCRHLNERLEFGMESVAVLSAIFINNNGTIIPCRTAIIDLGLSDVDPGLVPDGAKCGEDKMCYKQRCVPIEAVRAKVAALDTSVCPSDCNGHGICNSEGHCHCEPGFAPPDCALPGAGGSYDSGPATDPSVQRNFMVAMYVIFLGIVPTILLVMLLFYYSRHNMAPFWKKPRKSYVTNLFSSDKHKSFFTKFPKTSSVRHLLSFKLNNKLTRTEREESPYYDTVCELNDTKEENNLPKTSEQPLHYKILHLTDKSQKKLKKPEKKLTKEDIVVTSTTDLTKPPIAEKPVFASQNDLNKVLTKNLDSKKELKTPPPTIKPKPNLNLPKDNKPSVVIVKQGLASTTNEMLSQEDLCGKPQLYNIKSNGLYSTVSGKSVKVQEFKK